MHDGFEFYSKAAEAAEQILEQGFGISISKALDPTKDRDFVTIIQRISNELFRETGSIERKSIEQALDKLDVDWVKLTPKRRNEIILAASASIGLAADKVIPVANKIFDKHAEPIVLNTKKSTFRQLKLPVPIDLSPRDKRVVRFVSKSQSNFVRDEFGRRRKMFSARARHIVSGGLDKGLGSKEISRELNRRLGPTSLARRKPYWDNIASIYANRGRTFSQISSFQEAGIKRYKFEAIMDEATSNICRYMHGKTFSVDEGIKRIDEVERLRDPEKIRDVQPFVQDGVDDEGKPIMYYGGRAPGERRVTVARITESGLGTKDKRGSFSGGLKNEQLSNAGISMPPLHGKCRSTVVAI